MYPVLFEFSEKIKIYSFGTFIVIAFLVASWYVRRRAQNDLGVDRERSFNICFALLFIGLAGARLMYVLLDYDQFSNSPMSVFMVWRGGLVWYGGLAACLLWLSWYLPRHPKLGGRAYLDRLALGAGLAIAVGRWASFLSGENYGKPAPDLPWAVTFPPHPDLQAEANIALHPTQLYHSLHGLILFGLLMLYMRRKPAPGRTAGLFLMLYAVGRSIIEIWRGDEPRGVYFDGMLSTSQIISIPVFFIGIALFLLSREGSAGTSDPSPEAGVS